MSVVVRRYTKALYELSDTQGVAEQVWEDLRQFGNIFVETTDLLEVAKNPLISKRQAASALEIICQQADFHPLTTSFLKLLADKRRLRFVPEIINAFGRHIDKRLGLIRGDVESAKPLTRAHITQLEDVLSKKLQGRVQLRTALNNKLLGGMVLRVGSYLMDSSLDTQLSMIQKRLKG